MSMKVIKLCLYWDASDANTVIDFIDTLREALLQQYAESIIEMRTRALDTIKSDPGELDFDDNLDI